MSKFGLFFLTLILTLHVFALETVGHIKKIISDDEGVKIYFDGIFENSKPNTIFYLKNTHPQFDKISAQLQSSLDSKKSVVLKFQKNQIQLVESIKELKQ